MPSLTPQSSNSGELAFPARSSELEVAMEQLSNFLRRIRPLACCKNILATESIAEAVSTLAPENLLFRRLEILGTKSAYEDLVLRAATLEESLRRWSQSIGSDPRSAVEDLLGAERAQFLKDPFEVRYTSHSIVVILSHKDYTKMNGSDSIGICLSSKDIEPALQGHLVLAQKGHELRAILRHENLHSLQHLIHGNARENYDHSVVQEEGAPSQFTDISNMTAGLRYVRNSALDMAWHETVAMHDTPLLLAQRVGSYFRQGRDALLDELKKLEGLQLDQAAIQLRGELLTRSYFESLEQVLRYTSTVETLSSELGQTSLPLISLLLLVPPRFTDLLEARSELGYERYVERRYFWIDLARDTIGIAASNGKFGNEILEMAEVTECLDRFAPASLLEPLTALAVGTADKKLLDFAIDGIGLVLANPINTATKAEIETVASALPQLARTHPDKLPAVIEIMEELKRHLRLERYLVPASRFTTPEVPGMPYLSVIQRNTPSSFQVPSWLIDPSDRPSAREEILPPLSGTVASALDSFPSSLLVGLRFPSLEKCVQLPPKELHDIWLANHEIFLKLIQGQQIPFIGLCTAGLEETTDILANKQGELGLETTLVRVSTEQQLLGFCELARRAQWWIRGRRGKRLPGGTLVFNLDGEDGRCARSGRWDVKGTSSGKPLPWDPPFYTIHCERPQDSTGSVQLGETIIHYDRQRFDRDYVGCVPYQSWQQFDFAKVLPTTEANERKWILHELGVRFAGQKIIADALRLVCARHPQ